MSKIVATKTNFCKIYENNVMTLNIFVSNENGQNLAMQTEPYRHSVARDVAEFMNTYNYTPSSGNEERQ